MMESRDKENIRCLKEAFNTVAPEVLFDKINFSTPLRNQIEIDSFDYYNIFVFLQKKTGVFIPDSKVSEILNIDDLLKYILEKQQNTQGLENVHK
jgi:acyl carrier protein